MKKSLKIVFLLMFLVGATFQEAHAEGIVKLFGVQVKRIRGGGLQLIIPSNEPVKYIDFQMEQPKRIVIDLIGDNIYTDMQDPIAVNASGVKKIVPYFYRQDEPTLGRKLDQITIFLDGDPKYKVYSSKYSIIVDINIPEGLEKFGPSKPYQQPYHTTQTPDNKQVTADMRSSEQMAPGSQRPVQPQYAPRNIRRPFRPPSSQPQQAADAPQFQAPAGQPPYNSGAQGPPPPPKPEPREFSRSHMLGLEEEEYKDGKIPNLATEAADQRFSLEECIHIALENYEPCRIALKEVELAQLRVKQARRAKYPTASVKWQESKSVVSGGLANSIGRKYTLEFQQPLYRSGELKNSYNQAMVNLEVTQERYEKVRQDLIFEVEKAFYALAAAMKREDLYNNLTDESKRIADIIQKRYEAGLSRRLEYLSIQSMLNQIEFKMQQNQNDLTLAKITLQHVMNLRGDDAIIEVNPEPLLTEVTIKDSVEDCIELARSYRPDLIMNELLVKMNEYGVKISSSRGKPSLNLSGLVGRGAEDYETEPMHYKEEWFIGLEFKYPFSSHLLKNSSLAQDRVPQAGQTDSTEFHTNTLELAIFDPETMKINSDKKAAVIEYDKAWEQLNKAEQALTFEIKDSFFKYKKSVLTLKDASNKVELSEEQVKVTKAMSELNEVAISELLKSELELSDNNAAYYQALADHHTSIAELNKAIGISGYFDWGKYDDKDLRG